MNAKVTFAVFRRNFVSYFSSPTGYVFICVFVLLSAIAAFWVHEFFNANLANLNQLSKAFPLIMLVFIPAITMSVWADERRQGTDELLLTIPAGDFDIVLGKYLAAVAIYTVALLFSLVCNYTVLATLGSPDVGLFLATYIGYWLVGLAMLAVGMVASFLTGNITVSYVLGALFNAPLVFFVYGDVLSGLVGNSAVRVFKQWSYGGQFLDFGRGILSFTGLVYFLMIVAVMLYLSMVLIGRRHWVRGAESSLMVGHFALRVVALVVIAMGLTLLFSRLNIHKDVTSEQLTALSNHTEDVLENLEPERPVEIEAFISPEVPETYEPTRLNLISMLQELEGDNVIVRLNDTELFSEEAARAETRYGIQPRTVVSRTRGTWSEDRIFMGVAFKSGLEKVIVPFVDRGIPVEYELVRSIATVSQQKRRKIGVIRTDAQLYGQFNMQTMSPPENWPIINELEKQYEVEEVDPTSPIVEEYDALLAVQPSSLGPEEMDNFVGAIRSGVPTAIFEDPFPYFARSVPATLAQRRPPGGMNPMMMQMQQQQGLPKGDIQSLWSLLGVEFSGDQIVWQNYNPVPKLSELDEEFVFVDAGCKADEPFNERNEISSGLQHMLFPFPGWVSGRNTSELDFTALVRTGPNSGTVAYYEMTSGFFGMMGGLNPNRRRRPGGMEYVLAARIEGDVPELPDSDEGNGNGDGEDTETADFEDADESTEDEPQTSSDKDGNIKVVLVADIDMLHHAFFRIREMGEVPESEMHLDFDNVTFVLNVLDNLAGEERFIDIRKRRRQHRTLSGIELATEAARKKTTQAREDAQKEFEKIEDEENDKFQDRIKKIEDQLKDGNLDLNEIARRVDMARQVGEKQMKAKVERAEKERDQKVEQIEKELALDVRRVQDNYKMWAVLIPPIPPLIVAVIVFLTRRVREREGVARTRLRG